MIQSSIKFTRGYLSVVGEHVDALASANLDLYDVHLKLPDNLHITLLTKEEVKLLDINAIPSIKLDISDLGLGCIKSPESTTYFKVIYWSQGNKFRQSLSLPPKDFHISLGSHNDIHNFKGIQYLIPLKYNHFIPPHLFDSKLKFAKSEISDPNIIHFLSILLSSTNDIESRFKCLNLTSYIQLKNKQFQDCINTVTIMLDTNKSITYTRLADCFLKMNFNKLSVIAYLHAWHFKSADSESYVVDKLNKCDDIWINNVLEQDISVYNQYKHLFKFTKMNELNAICELLMRLEFKPVCIENRQRYLVNNVKLPRKFTWIVPGVLAGMSTPRNAEDILILKSLNIAKVFTLTKETPLDAAWFDEEIKNEYIPVENYKAPTFNQVDYILQQIMKSAYLLANNQLLPVLVHCGGGIGRAGTVIAAFLIKFGFSVPYLCAECFDNIDQYPDLLSICNHYCCTNTQPMMSSEDAVAILRKSRPNSIETVEQEMFLKSWASMLYKRQYIEEPINNLPDLEIVGTLSNKPSFIICCGLPGSGKSSFSSLVYKRISQDECDGKQDFLSSINHRQKYQIFDRCNARASDRMEIINLLFQPQDVVCVYFNASLETCLYRANKRLKHPNLVNPKNALEQFNKIFEVPELKEGFSAICTVGTFKGSDQLLTRLGVKLEKDVFYKYPRTCHLLNLGAVNRDDLVLTATDFKQFSNPPSHLSLCLEEKIDGANLGISLKNNKIMVQNRSHYVNSKYHTQFKSLDKWISDHEADLMKILKMGYILYGEWMAATHAIAYSKLPELFIAFDLFDLRKKQFVSRRKFEEIMGSTGIHCVAKIKFELPLTKEKIVEMVQQQSCYYDGKIEGIYFRLDSEDWLENRAKVVRGDFICGNDHWTKGIISWNGVVHE